MTKVQMPRLLTDEELIKIRQTTLTLTLKPWGDTLALGRAVEAFIRDLIQEAQKDVIEIPPLPPTPPASRILNY
jgi:hypothetical protein